MRTNDSHFASSLKSGNGQNFQFVRLQGMQKVFLYLLQNLKKVIFQDVFLDTSRTLTGK